MAASDSIDWADSCGFADRSDSNAPSLSHQAATLGIRRFSFEDLQQRGVAFCGGTTQTLQDAAGDPWAQLQPQPRSEKCLQGCGDPSCCRSWTVSGVLRRFSRQRNETVHGTPHPGTQDCGDYFTRLEERSPFRRRTSEATSSLSVCVGPSI